MDYGKFRYEQTKKEKESKKRQNAVKIKEVKIRPGIFEHDFQIKLEHIREFLTTATRSRHADVPRPRDDQSGRAGEQMIDRLNSELAGVGAIEVKPKLMGRSIIFIIGRRSSYKSRFGAPQAALGRSERGVEIAENENQQVRGQAFQADQDRQVSKDRRPAKPSDVQQDFQAETLASQPRGWGTRPSFRRSTSPSQR
jgi:translation initiation factor IF-3